MKTAEILKMVEWYAARSVDHFRLATHETSHDLRVSLDAIAAALSQAEASRVALDGALAILGDLASEFERVYPIYYYAEPWAHDRNIPLQNAKLLLAARKPAEVKP